MLKPTASSLTTSTGRYKQDTSGDAFTRIRLEQLRREVITAQADSALAPGVRFNLTDHDIEGLNRDGRRLTCGTTIRTNLLTFLSNKITY